MMVFFARWQRWFAIASPGFACRARSFASHLREVINSSQLVKVVLGGHGGLGSAIQVGSESLS